MICATAVALADTLHFLVDVPSFGLLAPLILAVWPLPILVNVPFSIPFDVPFDVSFGVPSLKLSALLDLHWLLSVVVSFPSTTPLTLLSHAFANPTLYIISFFVLPALAVTVF